MSNACANEGRMSSATMREIVKSVSDYFDLPPHEIFKKHRPQNAVRARNMVFYLARTMTNASYPQIGSYMKRDHTTVIYGVNKTKEALSSSDELKRAEARLRYRLENIVNAKSIYNINYWGA